MATGKKTFIFYSDWINMVREMPDSDAGALLKHVLSYVNDEEPITDNPFVKMAFGHMKPLLKKDLDKWEKQLEHFSDMGKKSAELRRNKPKLTHVEPTLTNVERGNTVNDNVNVNERKTNIPSFSDFLDYAILKKPKVNKDCIKLKFDSWVENDWQDGNDKPIKNWKTKLLNTLPYIEENKARTNPNKTVDRKDFFT